MGITVRTFCRWCAGDFGFAQLPTELRRDDRPRHSGRVAILPQALPVLIGTTIYRWDINVRESSVLGFVGAGGIGIYLYASINAFAWSQVLVILIAILVIVALSEALSAAVRTRIS